MDFIVANFNYQVFHQITGNSVPCQPIREMKKLSTKICNEGGGEACGGHGEGDELTEEEHEQQAAYILPPELHGFRAPTEVAAEAKDLYYTPAKKRKESRSRRMEGGLADEPRAIYSAPAQHVPSPLHLFLVTG
jgi:hypothetical protein